MSQDDVILTNGKRNGAVEYAFGAYRLRSDDLVLSLGGTEVSLAPKVALTLLALVERAGRVASKEELLQTVWGGAAVEDANISQNIYMLRRLFEANGGTPVIETLPRRGYRLCAQVRTLGPADPAARRSSRFAVALLAAATAIAACGAALIMFAPRVIDVAPSAPTPPELAAQQAYWTGWLYYCRGTEYGLQSALASFKRAESVDPTSALGPSGEAIAYASLSDFESSSASGVADAERADWLAHHVLATRTSSAVALAAKGFVEYDIDGDFAGAALDLKRADALDPQNAAAHLWYGGVLLWQGKLAMARLQLQRATSLDSTIPSADYLLAWDYYFSRDYGSAIAFARLAIADPWTSNEARLLLAASDEEAGRFAPAIAAVNDLVPGPTDVIAASATRAHVYAAMGDPSAAARELKTVEALTARYGQRPLLTAVAYLANGRIDEAFAWLSRLSHFDRTMLALDPRLDRIRRDPRFVQWLHG